jgi:hypothetical protein
MERDKDGGLYLRQIQPADGADERDPVRRYISLPFKPLCYCEPDCFDDGCICYCGCHIIASLSRHRHKDS